MNDRSGSGRDFESLDRHGDQRVIAQYADQIDDGVGSDEGDETIIRLRRDASVPVEVADESSDGGFVGVVEVRRFASFERRDDGRSESCSDRVRHVNRPFYAEVLGFQVREVTGDALYLSGLEERAHHSIVFERSDADPQCRALGFRVADEEELERAAHWFAQAGRAFEWVERPFQGRTMAVRDDTGTPLELTAEMGAAESLLQQFHRYRRGSPLRLDHVQVVSHDVGESANLYARLGFRITEYTYRAQTEEIWGIWLQRKGNRHDIVFSNGRGPRLHHFAFAVPEVRDLIHVCDAAASLGHAAAMERGPGRHGIGNALFVYFRDPDAHRIELFNGHYQAIGNEHAPIGWELGDTRRSQLWGLPARASWFFEATEFEGLAVRNSKLAALPVTLEDYLARAV